MPLCRCISENLSPLILYSTAPDSPILAFQGLESVEPRTCFQSGEVVNHVYLEETSLSVTIDSNRNITFHVHCMLLHVTISRLRKLRFWDSCFASVYLQSHIKRNTIKAESKAMYVFLSHVRRVSRFQVSDSPRDPALRQTWKQRQTPPFKRKHAGSQFPPCSPATSTSRFTPAHHAYRGVQTRRTRRRRG